MSARTILLRVLLPVLGDRWRREVFARGVAQSTLAGVAPEEAVALATVIFRSYGYHPDGTRTVGRP